MLHVLVTSYLKVLYSTVFWKPVGLKLVFLYIWILDTWFGIIAMIVLTHVE